VGHDTTNRPPDALSREDAEWLATIMQAFGTASRLLLLDRLRSGPLGVGELAFAIDMDRSSVSHQLRVLRQLGLVTVNRSGRTATYALHDDHVHQLVEQAVHHLAHR
jgi:ArsR family transcriptional regulator, nickel/cobalt-responsive transcriptional repressor